MVVFLFPGCVSILEEVQLTETQSGQVVWTWLDGTEVPETVEKMDVILGPSVSDLRPFLRHNLMKLVDIPEARLCLEWPADVFMSHENIWTCVWTHASQKNIPTKWLFVVSSHDQYDYDYTGSSYRKSYLEVLKTSPVSMSHNTSRHNWCTTHTVPRTSVFGIVLYVYNIRCVWSFIGKTRWVGSVSDLL